MGKVVADQPRTASPRTALTLMLWRIALEIHRPVELLIRPQATYAHHSAVGLADMLAPLAVPVLVYY